MSIIEFYFHCSYIVADPGPAKKLS